MPVILDGEGPAIKSDALHGARPHAVWPSAALSYKASTSAAAPMLWRGPK
jgi:hypothetical protein